MADRYFRNGTGTPVNWASTGSWSATSGGATGASFPVAGDNAIFDANSGTGTCTVAAAAACANLTMTGFTGGLAGSSALNISGSAAWAGTITYTGAITYSATTTGKTITHNGKALGSNVTLNGVGGGWTLTDAASTTGTWTLTNGAFADAGFGHTASVFNSNNSNIRSVVKSGVWTATGTGIVVGFQTVTNFSMVDTGSWSLTNATATARTVSVGGLVLNDLAISAGTMAQTITGSATYRNINWTGFSGSWASVALAWTGDMTMSATMTVTPGTPAMSYTGSGISTLRTNGVLMRPITVNAPGGELRLFDALSMDASRLTLTAGTLRTMDKAVTCNDFVSNNTNVRALYLGASLFTVAGFFPASNNSWFVSPVNMTLDAGTSTIKFTDSSSADKNFNGGDFTYNVLWYAPGAGTGKLNFGISTNGFVADVLKDDGTGAHTLQFAPALSYSVRDLQVSGGSAGARKALASSTPGTTFTLTKTGAGVFEADYLSVSDMVCGPGYRMFAGDHSVNGGNNLAVAFTTPKGAALMAA